METETKNTKISRTGAGKLIDIKGTWKLTYNPIGTLGASGFGGKTLMPYPHPRDHSKVYRLSPDKKPLAYYMVSTINTLLEPDTNPQDRMDVEWMLHHPEIIVEGYKDLPKLYIDAKDDDARLTLTALDYQEVDNMEEQDYIDKLVGRLSIEGGPNAIGREKLQYILAQLDKPYLDARHMNDNVTLKKVLKSRVKTFVKSSLENARLVQDILENITQAQVTFELKEMIRLEIIQETNGQFKHQNVPLGVSIRGILQAWEQQPELRVTMQRELVEKSK